MHIKPRPYWVIISDIQLLSEYLNDEANLVEWQPLREFQ